MLILNNEFFFKLCRNSNIPYEINKAIKVIAVVFVTRPCMVSPEIRVSSNVALKSLSTVQVSLDLSYYVVLFAF